MGTALRHRLADVVGTAHVSTDPDVLAGRSIDWTGRYRGRASALVRPGSTDEVAAVLRSCRDAGVRVTVQGGRTSLVAGTVPEHDDVLLSTERLIGIGDVDAAARRVRVGAGVTLSQAQRAAAAAGLLIGVDLTSRDSATIGGMVSTDAGGLHTVCYGAMGKQVLGLEVALPDGSVLRPCVQAGAPNTGYDLTALFAGAEGTLGVITAVDLRLHPIPAHRATALCGFADLDALVSAARILRGVETIAALELIDGRPSPWLMNTLAFPLREARRGYSWLNLPPRQTRARPWPTPWPPPWPTPWIGWPRALSPLWVSTAPPSSAYGKPVSPSPRWWVYSAHRSNSMSRFLFRRSVRSRAIPTV